MKFNDFVSSYAISTLGFSCLLILELCSLKPLINEKCN